MNTINNEKKAQRDLERKAAREERSGRYEKYTKRFKTKDGCIRS